MWIKGIILSFSFPRAKGGIEFDFFAICEKDETNKILVEAKKNNFVPDVKVRDEINGKTVEIKYEGVEKPFV